MKLFYTGSYCDEELFSEIFTSQKDPPSYAQQKFERLLLDGFGKNGCSVEAALMIPVRSYPGNKKLIVRSKTVRTDCGRLTFMGMPNLLVLKQIAVSVKAAWRFFIWAARNAKDRSKCYFSYAVNPPVTLPCLALARLFGCKSAVLVSEHPRLRAYRNQDSALRRLLLKLLTGTSVRIYRQFDAYVTMAEAMNAEVNPKGKPHVTVEGMTGDVPDPAGALQCERPPSGFAVMYAGALDRRNGIELLVEGFAALDGPGLELWLFGDGDWACEALNRSQRDPRIKCFGNVPNGEVLEMLGRASLLANPRPSGERFTEFSFPSKTIEYMASGTPLLTTRLKGIPEGYFEHLYTLEDESAEGVKSAIAAILADGEGRKHKGLDARKFILENKNNAAQTKKIVELLMAII